MTYKTTLDNIFDIDMINESWKDKMVSGLVGAGLGAGVIGMTSASDGGVTSKYQDMSQSTTLPVDEPKITPEFFKQMSSKKDKKEEIKYPVSKKDAEVIASTLIGEAGGEYDKGSMQSILNVIMNRAKNNPSNMAKVALKPFQFSYFNDKTPEQGITKAKKHPRWGEAIKMVNKALLGKLDDITDGATHYHVHQGQSKVTPSWTNPSLGGKNHKAKITKTVGNHVFLNNVD